MLYNSHQPLSGNGTPVYQRNFVFPYDAEDIKAHKWFRGLPWDRLHQLSPPFVPMIRSAEDTQYFDEDQPMTDPSDTEDEQEDQQDALAPFVSSGAVASRHGVGDKATPTANKSERQAQPASIHDNNTSPSLSQTSSLPWLTEVYGPVSVTAPTNGINTSASPQITEREVRLAEALGVFDQNIQQAVRSWLMVPYDSLRLRNFELQVDAEPGLQKWERDALKAVVRVYGRKERKRPRDRLLRDPSTRKVVLAERMKTAFMGYDWRRVKAPPTSGMWTIRATESFCSVNGLQATHVEGASAVNHHCEAVVIEPGPGSNTTGAN